MSDADELVRRLILRRFREDRPSSHLATCPEVELTGVDASDGEYGCDTGCEFARFEATVSCPHGESTEFEWGEFGEISYMIEDMEDDERRAANPQPPPVPTPLIEYVQVPQIVLGPGDTATWTSEMRIE